ncbi:MAG TPA: hypothetical protein VHG08_07925 [Longimicrobium sp.]|nr:hypothetical protein [Longimicrobium sp.]
MSIKDQIANLRGRGRSNGRAANASAPPSASVDIDMRSGNGSVRFSRGGASSAEYEISAEWLIFLSHYIRARRAFTSDVQMAEMLGLDRTRLIAWKKGTSAPRHGHVRYLADVATTVDTLLRFLHPSVVAAWLTTPQYELDDRTPVEMLRQGNLPEVLQTVNATEQGAY